MFHFRPVLTPRRLSFQDEDLFLSLENMLLDWSQPLDSSAQIIQVEGGFEIHMTVPGIDPKSLNVEVENGILKLTATQEKESKHTFFRDGLSRSWSLPGTTNLDGVTATCKNGILTIKVPVDDTHKKASKKIPITP